MTPITPVPARIGMPRDLLGADLPLRAANDAESDTQTAPLASAIYEGWVRHRRFAPHANHFRYRMYMLYIDLAEVDQLFSRRWLWSVGRRNIAQFRRSDYFGDPGLPLAQCVRDRVEQETGVRPRGPIRLLAHLRYFGFCFNPVSFYYCFAEDGVTLETIVADITNTPWKERHAYVLPISRAHPHGTVHAWHFDKVFHVSPFLPMQCRYDWRFGVPQEHLRVHMGVKQTSATPAPSELQFDATLVLQRRAFNASNLARVLARHPFMTFKVVAAIHWQALRIWWRGNPVFDHAPAASGNAISPAASAAVPENHDEP